MDSIFRFPGKAYDYISYHYGFIGLMVAALLLIMFVIGIYFWWDRRKI